MSVGKRERLLCLFVMMLLIPVGGVVAQEEDKSQESRIDFGNAYIKGQSITSGAVYLTNRRKSAIKSLLKTRESYRYEIVKDFYGGEVEIVESEIKPEVEPDRKSDKCPIE